MDTNKNTEKPDILSLFRDMLDDHLGRKEFLAGFENVIKHVKDAEKKLDGDFKALSEALTKYAEQIRSGSDTDFQTLKAELQSLFSNELDTQTKRIDKKLAEVDAKLATVENGQDADEVAIIERVIERVISPATDGIQKNIPQLGVPIRDALELLQGDERLDISAIKGTEELFEKNGKGEVRVIAPSRGMFLYTDGVKKGLISNLNFKAGTGVSIAYSKVDGQDTITFNASGGGMTVETPPESPDASTTVFTVSAEPKYVVADGTTYFDGAGYSYASLQVTMDIPPSASIRAII